MRHVVKIVLVVMMSLFFFEAEAQRRITPVTEPAGRNENSQAKAADKSNLMESLDSNGNIILIDTVTGTEYVDTTAVGKRVIAMIYPRLYQLSVGVNIWDAALRALGQHYGLGSARVTLSLHNRYFPSFEAGLSTADETPDGGNYTFRSGLAPYFKLGFAYNLFYNSNPDYQLMVGLRYGLSAFSYKVDNVTVDEGYWGDAAHFDIPSTRSTTGWLEVAAGLKVRIAGPVSLGWDLIYHRRLHQSATPYGPPMVIPGYGKRGSSFTGNFSVIYTIDLARGRKPASDGREEVQEMQQY